MVGELTWRKRLFELWLPLAAFLVEIGRAHV